MDKKPKEWEFISNVIDWVKKPMNRSVVDYHLSCMNTMKDKKFRKEIETFLKQRFSQMYVEKADNMPKGFFGRSVTMYIQDVL